MSSARLWCFLCVLCWPAALHSGVWGRRYGDEDAAMLRGAVSGSTVCKTVPGLSRQQLDLCQRQSDAAAAALHGLQLAVRECQHQFRWNRWNCSSLATKNQNPHSSALFQRGYRESAFAYAISAAGVAHSVARACSQGRVLSCGCGPHGSRARAASRWKWGGCSHNLHYGMQFSRMFLDSRERAADIHSSINLHNNQAGRLAVANNMQVRCKCHGMSGSCELRTCWRSAPDFRLVGRVLKNRFRKAVLVNQSNMGNGPPLVLERRRDRRRQRKRQRTGTPAAAAANSVEYAKKRKRRRGLDTQLLYYQKSPNFCERDAAADVPGTAGRLCNRTSSGSDGCGSLCCGRGYNVLRTRHTERCHCRFHWCCQVECQNCTVEQWITVCK